MLTTDIQQAMPLLTTCIQITMLLLTTEVYSQQMSLLTTGAYKQQWYCPPQRYPACNVTAHHRHMYTNSNAIAHQRGVQTAMPLLTTEVSSQQCWLGTKDQAADCSSYRHGSGWGPCQSLRHPTCCCCHSRASWSSGIPALLLTSDPWVWSLWHSAGAQWYGCRSNREQIEKWWCGWSGKREMTGSWCHWCCGVREMTEPWCCRRCGESFSDVGNKQCRSISHIKTLTKKKHKKRIKLDW